MPMNSAAKRIGNTSASPPTDERKYNMMKSDKKLREQLKLASEGAGQPCVTAYVLMDNGKITSGVCIRPVKINKQEAAVLFAELLFTAATAMNDFCARVGIQPSELRDLHRRALEKLSAQKESH